MGGLGGDMGGDMDMDLGEPGTEDGGDLGGEAGETDMGNAPEADTGEPLMEVLRKKGLKINEIKHNATKSYINEYFGMLNKNAKEERDGIPEEAFNFEGKTVTMQENIRKVLDKFENLVDEDALERETIINEAIESLDLPQSGETEQSSDSIDIGDGSDPEETE
jgi:hypothetical protein